VASAIPVKEREAMKLTKRSSVLSACVLVSCCSTSREYRGTRHANATSADGVQRLDDEEHDEEEGSRTGTRFACP